MVEVSKVSTSMVMQGFHAVSMHNSSTTLRMRGSWMSRWAEREAGGEGWGGVPDMCTRELVAPGFNQIAAQRGIHRRRL